MVERRALHEQGQQLALRTHLGGKEVDGDHVHGLSRPASLNSIATSADEAVNTHLSASSNGRTDTISSELSAHSTARTSTSVMTEDDAPGASSPAIASPHAHPTLTVLELASSTASSSALPDSFGFNVSRRGHFVAVYTASNIWLIQAAQLPRLWARTLQVKRKPLAVDIQDNGFLFAVLSRPVQVDIYEIHGEQQRQIKKRRTVMLVHESSSVAISPDGLILITGNTFGIEVVSIGPDAPESCRRTLSGPAGDTLEFSDDGRTLLVTSYARKNASSAIFVLPGLYDGPLSDDGVPIPASPEALWTGQVLFPERARIARQATLLPDADTGQVSELFAFNADEDTWGVYDIAGQHFTQRKMFLPDQQRWTRSEFIDDAMPAISPSADLAAVALRIRGTTSIWIYQVPEWDFQASSKTKEPQPLIQPCFCIPILHGNNEESHQELSVLRWVRIDANVQRLLAVGNIGGTPCEAEGPIPTSSKGVVIVLDFDATRSAGSQPAVPTKIEYDLDPLLPGETLPEGAIDFEREVELVRTRTVAQRRAQDHASSTRRSPRVAPSAGRARTTANRERHTSTRPAAPVITREDEELTSEEAQAAFEAPYDNTQPRSQMSLARAATVAAVSPANRRHLRALPFRPLEYRRADGLREFPHESDADNWVPPPPAYTATAEASQSVSLSHPNAPPAQARVNGPASTSPTALPVPVLPAGVQNPQRQNSQRGTSLDLPRGGLRTPSSSDLSPAPHERRPSLPHTSSYPSSLAPTASGRRGSSISPAAPDERAPAPESLSQSAYRTMAASFVPTRPRRAIRTRRAVEGTVDMHTPSVEDATFGRRGSAPVTSGSSHRRHIPLMTAVSQNRVSLPSTPGAAQGKSNVRRAMLPRLSTVGEPAQRREPVSAPPRTNFGLGDARQPMTSDTTEDRERPPTRQGKEKNKSPKKVGCVVM